MTPTSADQIPALTGAELARAGRSLAFPATVRLSLENGECVEVRCEAALRVLPARRVVTRGVLDDGRPIVAKLFLGKHAARDLAAERQGLSLAREVGLNVPAVIADGMLDDAGRGLLVELLGDAERVDVAHIGDLAAALAALHRDNLICIDPHFGNFLVSGERIWMVDGGAIARRGVLSEARRVANLALLLAQCAQLPAKALAAAWTSYASAFYGDGELSPPRTLMDEINRSRVVRARRLARKSLRDCSEFRVECSYSRRVICRRDITSSPIMAMLEDIDATMQRGEVLKAGNSATVVRVRVGDRDVVIKRYNLKNWRHALRRALQPSRAVRAWQAGHQLLSLGVPTPEPLVLLEHRLGPLRRKSYLITQALEGPNLQAYVHENGPDPAVVEASVSALVRLHQADLVHGDTKATNFIVAEPDVCMVDLDGVRGLRRGRQEAEVNRFLANWTGADALAFSQEFARDTNKS